jgi:hypothetical protein
VRSHFIPNKNGKHQVFLKSYPSHCCRHHHDWFHPVVFSLQEIHINQGEYGNFIPPRSSRLTDSKLKQKGKVKRKASRRNTGKIHQTLNTLFGGLHCGLFSFFLTQSCTSGAYNHKYEYLGSNRVIFMSVSLAFSYIQKIFFQYMRRSRETLQKCL